MTGQIDEMTDTTVDWEQAAREREGIWHDAIAERDEARAELERLRATLTEIETYTRPPNNTALGHIGYLAREALGSPKPR